jgi:hypothetical protein
MYPYVIVIASMLGLVNPGSQAIASDTLLM